MSETILNSNQSNEMRVITSDAIKELMGHTDANPYLSIRDFVKHYPSWTEASIRWLIYNNTESFNEIVVRRIGKFRILLSVKDFWSWIENQNQCKKQKA